MYTITKSLIRDSQIFAPQRMYNGDYKQEGKFLLIEFKDEKGNKYACYTTTQILSYRAYGIHESVNMGKNKFIALNIEDKLTSVGIDGRCARYQKWELVPIIKEGDVLSLSFKIKGQKDGYTLVNYLKIN